MYKIYIYVYNTVAIWSGMKNTYNVGINGKMETSWDVLKYIEIQWQWDMSNSTNSWKSICESLNETQKHVGY